MMRCMDLCRLNGAFACVNVPDSMRLKESTSFKTYCQLRHALNRTFSIMAIVALLEAR